MSILRNKAAAAAVLSFGLVALPLAGCESIERETGLGRQTQMGAAGGAAAGGVIAAIAGANPAWIAASTILGGVAGGALGEYLGQDEAEQAAQNNINALNSLGPGQSSSWSEGNASGSTTVNSVYTANGRTCKTFTEVIRTPEKTVSQDGTACRTADGSWQVQQV